MGLARRYGGGGQIASGVDQRDRTHRINGVSGIRFSFVGNQQFLAIGTELDHVGQGADVDGAEVNRQRRIGQIKELNKTVVGLDTVLHGNRQQLAEHRHALEGLAAVGRNGLGNDLGRSRIAQIADHNRA